MVTTLLSGSFHSPMGARSSFVKVTGKVYRIYDRTGICLILSIIALYTNDESMTERSRPSQSSFVTCRITMVVA